MRKAWRGAIAVEDYNLYSFEDLLRRALRDLHSGVRPLRRALELALTIRRCDLVVALHGLRGADARIDSPRPPAADLCPSEGRGIRCASRHHRTSYRHGAEQHLQQGTAAGRPPNRDHKSIATTRAHGGRVS
jgi:hypothetical protein